jgi:hypothetical protein
MAERREFAGRAGLAARPFWRNFQVDPKRPRLLCGYKCMWP